MRALRVGIGIAFAGLLAGAAAAQGPAGEAPEAAAAERVFDERGWLTCRVYSQMSPGLQSVYLIGLREGWQTSAGGLEANAARDELPEAQRASLVESAVWMRRLIDHGGVTYGEILERTRARCESRPESTVWQSWLDAIREARPASAPEE